MIAEQRDAVTDSDFLVSFQGGAIVAVGPRVAVGRLIQLPVGAVHAREDGPTGAPVLVLLHGFASSMHAFDRLTPMLAVDHRVIRIDLLGHGCSAQTVPDYGSASQGAMVESVLDRLAAAPGTVVGHSFGADVAIALAERGQHASRLVVIGQTPDYSSARLPRGNSVLSRLVVGRILRRVAPAPAIDRASRFAFAPGASARLLFDQPGRRAMDYRATSPAVGRTVLIDRPRLLAERGLDQRLRDLELPALVILGALDQLYPVAASRARYAAVANACVEVLDQSGHSPILEQPDETAALIRRFVTET